MGDGADAAMHDLLSRCGHRTLTSEALRQLYDVACGLDATAWERLAELAGEQGMQSLVLTHAAAAGLLPVMPERVAQTLLSSYSAVWIHNRRLRGQQTRILQALGKCGIEVIPIKGVILAERCYGELALRPIGDIDLLVHRADAPATGRILAGLGYAALSGENPMFDFEGLVYHTLSYFGGNDELIEVHWELANLPAYLPRLNIEDIWHRARQAPQAGQSVRVLAPEDELRYLCFHYAAQHQSARLIWLVDIAEFVSTLPVDWQWTAFVDQTITLGLATPVARSLARAQGLLGVSVPSSVLTQLRQASTTRREVAAWSSATVVFRRPDSLLRYLLVQPGVVERLMLLRALATRARRRVRRQASVALDRIAFVGREG